MSRTFVVGARFACPTCLSRGIARRCAKCKRACADLEAPDLAPLLANALDPRGLAPPQGGGLRGWWRRRSMASRAEWGISFVAALGIVISILASALKDPIPLAWLPLVFAGFFALVRCIVFLAVLVLRLGLITIVLALVLLLMIGMVVFTRAGSDTRAWLSDRGDKLLESALRLLAPSPARPVLRVSRAEPERSPPTRATITGEPIAILVFEGRAESMALADAVVPAFDIHTDGAAGERIHVDLGVGSIALDATFAPAQPHELADARPSWLAKIPANCTRHIAIPIGARIDLQGGAWTTEAAAPGESEGYRDVHRQRVLRGTTESPLHVRIARSEHGALLPQ